MANIAEQWLGTNLLMPGQRQALREAFSMMQGAYLAGPWEAPPGQLKERLEGLLNEVDPSQVYDLLNQLNWDLVGGYGVNATQERTRSIAESRRLFKYSPVAQWAIWLWTGWGLGDKVTVTVVDDKEEAAEAEASNAQEFWNEFWTAERNDALIGPDNIDELSDWTLVDGDTYLAYYASNVDGVSTVSEIPPDEITEIITDPCDSRKPLFYKREFKEMEPGATTPTSKTITWYYPDWQAYLSDDNGLDELFPGDKKNRTLAQVVLPEGAFRADTQEKVTTSATASVSVGGGEPEVRTEVCIQHIAHNRKERGSLWGWPLSTCGRYFTSAHKKFVESRLTVAEAKAMFVRRKKVESGSRGIKDVINTMASRLGQSQWRDTNPPPGAGSTEIDNKAITTTDLPMRTGAADAEADNKVFAWMASLGFGLFPTSMGLDTSRWATAVEMDKAQAMLFQRYQTFWASQLRRMVKVVLRMREKHKGVSFGDYTVDVSVDTFSLADFPGIADSIGELASSLLIPLVDVAGADAVRPIAQELMRICLQALGVAKAADLTSDEAFGAGRPTALPSPKGETPALPVPAEETAARLAAVIGQNMGAGLEWAVAELAAMALGGE